MRIARNNTYDLVVCGGGVAGFSAAVAAARKGLSVALVERMGCLGGTATSGGIHQMLGGRKLNPAGDRHIRAAGGIFDELTDQLIAEGNAIEPDSIDLSFNPFGWYPRMASGIVFDDIALKILMDEYCAQHKIRVYFNSMLIDVETDQDRIQSVIIANKDGWVRLRARLFADCTGDADLAAMAGCGFLKGNEAGLTAPCSLEMEVEHVDSDALVSWQNEHQSPKLVEIIEDLKQKGIWKFPYEIFVAVRLMEKDVFMVNTIRQIRVDGVSEASVSQALADGRKESRELFEVIRTYFPGFKNARIRKLSDFLGIRESRRISGRYTVTTADALEGKHYEDRVAATTYNFDLPDPLRPSYDPMMGDAKNPNAVRKHVVIQIPYQSLLPDKMKNLITAGRCISAEREVLGAVRVMGPCMMLGQAAGTAAAYAVEACDDFTAVPVNLLQKTLWKDGVIDPERLVELLE